MKSGFWLKLNPKIKLAFALMGFSIIIEYIFFLFLGFMSISWEFRVLLYSTLLVSFSSVHVHYLRFGGINFSIVLILAMVSYFIVGSVNLLLLTYIHPYLRSSIIDTTFFWFFYISLYCLGSLLINNKPIDSKPEYFYTIPTSFTNYLTIIALSGTIIKIIDIGFIPIIEGGTGSARYEVELTILEKLFELNVPLVLLHFRNFLKSKKKTHLFLTIFSLLQLSLFEKRAMVFFPIVALALTYIYAKEVRMKIIFYSLMGIIFFASFNSLLLNIRQGLNSVYRVQVTNLSNPHDTILTTFNEYPQFAYLLHNYTWDFSNGATLLAVPLSFLPYDVWKLFGIDKTEIKNYNSATIYAKFVDSKDSIGIRSGFAGELFVNFGYFGVIVMFLLGLLIGLFDQRVKYYDKKDIRLLFSVIIGGAFVYLLTVGQIDVFSSVLSNVMYLYIFFVLVLGFKESTKVVVER